MRQDVRIPEFDPHMGAPGALQVIVRHLGPIALRGRRAVEYAAHTACVGVATLGAGRGRHGDFSDGTLGASGVGWSKDAQCASTVRLLVLLF